MQTLPAVGVAMILVGLWTWTDLEIKRLQVRDSSELSPLNLSNLPISQPYVDLLHGDSPPQRSLLLDYTRTQYVR